MNVSFDGLRKNATRSMNALHDTIKDVLKSGDMGDSEKEELIENFNEAAMFVDTFNCLFDDSVEGDMTNMSDLNIDRLDEIKKEEEDE